MNFCTFSSNSSTTLLKRLIESLLFIAGLIFLLILVDKIILFGARRTNTIWNKIVNGSINADILVVGSSRTLVHFDCEIIESILDDDKSCFNLGLDGTPINLQLATLKTYFRYNKKPKIIIQQLDRSSVYTEYNNKEIYQPEQYTPYLDEKDIYKTLLSIDSTFWRHKYIPLYSFALYGRKITRQQRRVKGFLKKNVLWDDSFDKYKKTNPRGKEIPINKSGINLLIDVINLCKSNGIMLIFVYSPEYYEITEMTLNKIEFFETFEKLANEHKVPFWNYAMTPITLNKENFYNSQHLNAKGASIFSKLFAKKLKKHISNDNKSKK